MAHYRTESEYIDDDSHTPGDECRNPDGSLAYTVLKVRREAGLIKADVKSADGGTAVREWDALQPDVETLIRPAVPE